MKKGRSSKSNPPQKKGNISIEEESDTLDQGLNEEGSIENAEENTRFAHLNETKQSFLRELNDPRTKYMSSEQKLNSLIVKAEKLASFLLTKHKIFE